MSYTIQACDLIKYGCFCIGFINIMLNPKTLTGFTNLFFLNDFKGSSKMVLEYFHLLDSL